MQNKKQRKLFFCRFRRSELFILFYDKPLLLARPSALFVTILSLLVRPSALLERTTGLIAGMTELLAGNSALLARPFSLLVRLSTLLEKLAGLKARKSKHLLKPHFYSVGAFFYFFVGSIQIALLQQPGLLFL